MPASRTLPQRKPLERLSDSELYEDISFLLAKASAVALAEGNRSLAKLGLRVRSYSVLALAAGQARPSQRDLAHFLRLDASQIVMLVDELERDGLVVRELDRSDRRANVVVATPKGVEVFQAARIAVRDAEDVAYAGLNTRQRAQLAQLLHAIAFGDPEAR